MEEVTAVEEVPQAEASLLQGRVVLTDDSGTELSHLDGAITLVCWKGNSGAHEECEVIDDSYYDTAAYTNGASDHKPLYADVTLSPCTPVTYCSVADGSVDNTAGLSATGCSLFGSVSLELSNGPPNQLCYLLIGNGTGMVSDPPGAQGDLCLLGGGLLRRYAKDVGPISAAGSFSTDISNSLSGGPDYGIPGVGGQSIQAGDSFNFQYWYREPMGQPSRFLEALNVSFK